MTIGDDGVNWDDNWTKVQTNITYYDDDTRFNYFKDYLPPQPFKICELGCGPASWLPVWEKIGGIYYGIDFSPKAIERAVNKFPNNKFICNPAWHLYEFNEKFDVVFTNTFLQHVKNENKDLIIQRIHDSLKDKGLLITQEKCDVDTKTTMNIGPWSEFVKARGFEFLRFENNPINGFVFRKV